MKPGHGASAPVANAPNGSTATNAILIALEEAQRELEMVLPAANDGSRLGDDFNRVISEHQAEIDALLASQPELTDEIESLVESYVGLGRRYVRGTLTDADFFEGQELQQRLDSLLHELYRVTRGDFEHDFKKARNEEKQRLHEILRAAGLEDGNWGGKR